MKIISASLILVFLWFVVKEVVFWHGSPLHIAAMTGNRHIVAFALLFYKKDINSCNPIDQMSPIHYAVEGNKIEAVKILLENGADVKSLEGDAGRLPLHYAVSKNNLEIVKLLLQYGANPDCTGFFGKSAFDISKKLEDQTITNYMVKWKKDKENKENSH
jgi:ankyrin repeat protein